MAHMLGRRMWCPNCDCSFQREHEEAIDPPPYHPDCVGTGTGPPLSICYEYGPPSAVWGYCVPAGFPETFNPEEPDGPCAFDIDFNCYILCDGLEAGEGVPLPDIYYDSFNWGFDLSICGVSGNCNVGPLRSRRLTRVYKDHCFYEHTTVYTARRGYEFLTEAPTFDDYQVPPYGNPGPVPGWYGGDLFGYAHAMCGWYAKSFRDCAGSPYIDWLESGSYVTWQLTISGSTATLVGTTPINGYTITYFTNNWIHSTPSNPNVVNPMQITSYPNANCKGFPPGVCVRPSYFGYRSLCGQDVALRESCGPTNDIEGPWTLSLQLSDGMTTCGLCLCMTLHWYCSGNDATGTSWRDTLNIPDLTDCGFYYGRSEAQTGTYVAALVWCTGSGYKSRLYCGVTISDLPHSALASGWFAEGETSSITKCPYLDINIPYDVIADGTACCNDLCPCVPCDDTSGTFTFDIYRRIDAFTTVLVYSGTISYTPDGVYCVTFTGGGSDNVSIQVDFSTCTVLVNCNAGPGCDGTFNCLLISVDLLIGCDPFDASFGVTTGGLGCGACGKYTYEGYIYDVGGGPGI